MKTVLDLYNATRDRFPEITEIADRIHAKTWGEPSPEFSYSWFESLANALNNDMNKCVSADHHIELLLFLSQALHGCSTEIKNCIDVAFVENLFWQVPGSKAATYWENLPASLKELYIGFHKRAPL
ncbi:hypothetical protein KRX52_08675 [Pseudomonas sp. MAP12]|uniref:DUF7674 domain-containing protein n=1 Tax=Geopseudomonas aromaticivorans TaxID=2849492 RepID=A0ABS6MX90_9GAMM|nr:hypothetical protein [Pseudomonas aromaticivorans]MBV2132872.1 hypothetical protein [Pseudomonas aromaticivorans]